MSRTDPCPVKGCGYADKPGYVRQHLQRSQDPAHVAHRQEKTASSAQPATPAPEAPASPPEADPPASATEIEVHFEKAPVEEPLIPPSPSETPAPRAQHVDEDLDDLVVDAAAPSVLPAPTSAPVGLGSAMMSPLLADQINRFLTGAANNWILDPEKGDVPISREEVEALGTPQLAARIVDWLEAKYGWKLDLDHPIVWIVMWGLNAAGVVRRHRAPRGENGSAQHEAGPDEREDQGRAAPGPAPVPAPRSNFDQELEAIVG